jgi:hypothetical protein
MRVRWAELDDELYERAVAVLLSCIHPEAQRIDGAGGDDGRDVQLIGGKRLDLFQLKYFVGRIDNARGRRRQVERSLAKAATHGPNSWTVVVPIDPSPAEDTWFEKLRSLYSFPLSWMGLTELDRAMAQHPYVARYFFESAADEAIRLVREIAAEKTELTGGTEEAATRMRNTSSRLNEIDPYYRFDIEIVGGLVSFKIVPRFVGAELERPIVVRFIRKLPLTPAGAQFEEQLSQAFEFGEPLSVRATAIDGIEISGVEGVPHHLENVNIEITPVAQTGWSVRGRLSAVSPHGSVIASIPIHFDRRQVGTRGGTLFGRDATGNLSVSFRFDRALSHASSSIDFKAPRDQLPSTVLPLLSLLAQLGSPNLAVIDIDGAGRLTGAAPIDGLDVPGQYVELVRMLDHLQTSTGSYFPLPEQFSPDDVRTIRTAHRLVNGEVVEIRSREISIGLGKPRELAPLAQAIESGEPMNYRLVISDYTAEVAGNEMNLGSADVDIPAARIQTSLAFRRAIARGNTEGKRLKLVPASGIFLSLVVNDKTHTTPA